MTGTYDRLGASGSQNECVHMARNMGYKNQYGKLGENIEMGGLMKESVARSGDRKDMIGSF